jgi:hypothetical protein
MRLKPPMQPNPRIADAQKEITSTPMSFAQPLLGRAAGENHSNLTLNHPFNWW